jgi:hypothetical protein
VSDATDDVPVHVLLGSFDGDAEPPDPVHLAVRRFRAGEPSAVRTVVEIAAALPELMAELATGRAVAVAVPGHDGTISDGMRALDACLREAGGRAAAGPPVLTRHVVVPEAKRRAERDPSAEVASLRWIATEGVGGVERVVLLDDVVASGDTLRACATAMRRDGWSRGVTALVVARAITSR